MKTGSVWHQSFRLAILIPLSALLVLLGASPDTLDVIREIGAASAAPAEQVLTFAIDGDQATMDPQTTINATDAIVQLNVYEGLVRFKPETTIIEPALATDWRMSNDGLTWTFNLRKGVKFQDGTPFSAQAVKFSLDRMKAINKGMAFALRNVTAVQPNGDYAITIRLSKPDASFFVGLPSVRIVSPAAFGPHMGEDNATKWAYDHASGTGPYSLQSWERGRRLEMRKFDDYWGGWNYPHVDRIVQLTVGQFNSRRLMLQRGDVDFILRVEDDPTAAAALRKTPGVIIKTFPTLSITYIVMATNKGPLQDVRVRKAISYAIDYDEIQSLGYGFQAKRARGPIPSTILFYDRNLVSYKRDPARAKQLLADAGYPTGGFRLEFGYIGTVDAQRRIIEIAQQNLADLGITVVPKPMTSPELLASFTKPNTTLDLLNLNNHSPYPDPDFTFSQYFDSAARGPSGLNAAWYSNPEVDRLIEEGRTTSSPAERKKIYSRLQEIIVNDAPMIWNAELVFLIAARDYVKGFQYLQTSARSPGYLNHVYLAK